MLAGGSWDAPKEEVQPGFLSILDPSDPKIAPPAGMNSTGRRTALANWLADPKNPLTPRVMVNRIWHDHFGTGIVASTSDFGLMGERPSNPAAARLPGRYLRREWLEHQEDAPHDHAFERVSGIVGRAGTKRLAADPDNKLLWRYPRHRVEGEVIRDSMLLTERPAESEDGRPGRSSGTCRRASTPRDMRAGRSRRIAAEANRRSVYVFVKRVLTYPMFEAFDAPNPQESCPRRFRPWSVAGADADER